MSSPMTFPCIPSISLGISRSWRLTHLTTWPMPASVTAAACSNGARSASARSIQWAESPRCPDGRAAVDRARAVRIAISQSRQAGTGDHRSWVTPGGVGLVPAGSNTQQRPTSWRRAQVAASTSSLVEVDTTGPGARRMFGMTRDVVLPERGGPSTMTPCCGDAKTRPWVPAPRYNGAPP